MALFSRTALQAFALYSTLGLCDPTPAFAHEVPAPYGALAQAAPARITIGQAILIAEKEIGGEAVEAELSDEDGSLIYEVDVVKGKQEFEILISPETGEILSVDEDD